jgi:hypothetical protein
MQIIWKRDLHKRLSSVFAQALQAEVRRRQSAVLRPENDTAEAGMTSHTRQQRLSTARTLLSERLTAQAVEADAQLGGGFI